MINNGKVSERATLKFRPLVSTGARGKIESPDSKTIMVKMINCLRGSN